MQQVLKSLFIVAYPLICLAAITISLFQLNNEFTFTALALYLTGFPMILFLASLFLTDIARTSQNLYFYSFFVFGGFVSAIYGIIYETSLGWMPLLSIICVAGWLFYILWYSVFPVRDDKSLAIGQKLIDFPLEDAQGLKTSSHKILGVKNIFLFYRGNWCPLCVTQIKELAARYKELESIGIQTNLISPQSHKHTQSIAKKYDVGFKFWVDKNNSAAKALDIYSKNGLPFGFQVLGYESDTVMPTIILTDEQGQIVYSDLTSNYRIRPEPEEFLRFFNLN